MHTALKKSRRDSVCGLSCHLVPNSSIINGTLSIFEIYCLLVLIGYIVLVIVQFPISICNIPRFVSLMDVNNVADDENLRKSLGSFGRELVEKEFTINKMVDQTLELYKSLC